MATSFKIAPTLSLVAVFTGGHSAVAAPPAPTPLLSGNESVESGRPRVNREHSTKFLAARLDTLHTTLRLKPEQEAAWQKWAESVKAAPLDWKEKHANAQTLAKLTVPERLEKMVAFAKERLTRLENRLTETKAFYDVLSPEQRQTFDKDFNFWPHTGHGDKPAKAGKSLIGPRIGHQ